jgi:hypothetical protein
MVEFVLGSCPHHGLWQRPGNKEAMLSAAKEVLNTERPPSTSPAGLSTGTTDAAVAESHAQVETEKGR